MKRFFILATLLILSNCASTQPNSKNNQQAIKKNTSIIAKKNREKKILSNYSKVADNKFSSYLVNPRRYSTNGEYYQKRYHNLLISLAEDISSRKNLDIVKGTLGFYFNKMSNDKSKLYLGLDIKSNYKTEESFNVTALKFLKKYLKSIIFSVNSCSSVFEQKEIVGMVIGFRWEGAYGEDQVNIWIKKKDVFLFEKSKLTFSELIIKSFITNYSGKIVKLAM